MRQNFLSSPRGSLTAIATLSAIARLVVVHRAILAGLLTARLVCRETHCANRGCENRKENFEIIFHSQTSLATIVKASQKIRAREPSGKRGACPTTIRPAVCRTNAEDVFHHHSDLLHELVAACRARLRDGAG
jgi:hypothetical protein